MPVRRRLRPICVWIWFALGSCGASSVPTVEDSSEVQHLIAASESQPRSHLDDIEGYSKHITSMLVDPDRDYRFRWEQQVPLVRGEVNGVSLELSLIHI